MKYVFIEKHQAEFSIKAMCRVLRVARSGWYTWCQRRTRISTRQQFRQHCDSVVLAAFTRSKQRYGAPRLTDELRAQGYPFNVKTVAASLGLCPYYVGRIRYQGLKKCRSIPASILTFAQ